MTITKEDYEELYKATLPYAKNVFRKFKNLADRALEPEDIVSDGILKLIEGNFDIQTSKQNYLQKLIYNKLRAKYNDNQKIKRYENEIKSQPTEVEENYEPIEVANTIIDYCRRNVLIGVPPIDISLFLSYYLRTSTTRKWGESYQTLANETGLSRVSVLKKITNLTEYLSYLCINKYYVKDRRIEDSKEIITITKMIPNDKYPTTIVSTILSAQRGYSTNFKELLNSIKEVIPSERFNNEAYSDNNLKSNRKLLRELVNEAHSIIFKPIVIQKDETVENIKKPSKRGKRND